MQILPISRPSSSQISGEVLNGLGSLLKLISEAYLDILARKLLSKGTFNVMHSILDEAK